MISVLSRERVEVTKAVISVHDHAVQKGAPPCELLIVADDDRVWVKQVARLSKRERAGSVIGIKNESQLACAQRLGVGGAFRLPPAVGSVGAALESAAQVLDGLPTQACTDVESVRVCGDEPLSVVTISNRQFWCDQLGEGAVRRMLAAVSQSLESPAVVLPWPALLTTNVSRTKLKAVQDGFHRVGSPRRAVQLEVHSLGVSKAMRLDPVGAAFKRLVARSSGTDSDGESLVGPFPVHALPRGNRVGWWCSEKGYQPGDDCWVASPDGHSNGGYRWRLDHHDGSHGWVEDVVDPRLVAESESRVVRFPPWALCGLRLGSVSQLLLDAVAREAQSAGKIVWVSSVCPVALPQLLNRNGDWWVDGEAVPEG